MAEAGAIDARMWFRRLTAAAFWLGFALSGFFDGILLHQILQWHHLLSGLEGRGGPFSELAFQIAADGYFHVLMYVVAAAGLWLLWRARQAFNFAGASRALLAWLLIGFGAWHFVDAVASHWVTQIHRIKMDANNPLLWDIGWLVIFGAIPLAAGLMLRRPSNPAVAEHRRGSTVVSILALATAGAAAWSAQPPPGQTHTAVVFGPGMSFDEGLTLARDLGNVAWFNGGGVFIVKDARGPGWELYLQGALFVSGAGAPAGCTVWAVV
jgi:uncharacterized membrane protein